MSRILFFDLEINKRTQKVEKIGAVLDGLVFSGNSIPKFEVFSQSASYICGHNIFNHDLNFLRDANISPSFFQKKTIDTLYLSALLFSEKPYHHLVKNYKLIDERDGESNPVQDARLAKELLIDEINRFEGLDIKLRNIYYTLLKDRPKFSAFFEFTHFPAEIKNPEIAITSYFENKICQDADVKGFIKTNPETLAYTLALISTGNIDSISPPWLLHTYPDIHNIVFKLRQQKCFGPGCTYCRNYLDTTRSLLRFFGYEKFRKFNENEEVPLQEQVVNATLNRESLLAIFPTGGGKSLAFQLPAFMFGETGRELTIVISPLQSLMKDQVDNLENRFGITKAVTINGLLSPTERSEAFARVEDGEVHLLYISPESLRSPSIERLLLNRAISRFVIDEAHCFSSWGHDFRVDYLYIGEFIQNLMVKKGLKKSIPVSCFTATAKPQVIADIKSYFREKLSLGFIEFVTDSRRTNLRYSIVPSLGKEGKYNNLLNILSQPGGPIIIYASRTKLTEDIALSLRREGFSALPFHGKMETREKIANQDKFMNGETNIIVATSAFGMGVDKDDIKTIVHYDIPDSLESYIQETGRAGRDQSVKAECYVLFDENDLSKHFTLFYNSRLNLKEIAQVWRGLKNLSKFRNGKITKSALEIAKFSGWDIEMSDLETRTTTAIAVLEDAGFVKRTQNLARIFADSFLVKNVEKAGTIIREADDLAPGQKTDAKRIIQRIIKDDETRVDYLSETLGIKYNDVCHILNILRNKKIIGDAKDLTAFLDSTKSKNNALKVFGNYVKCEMEFLSIIKPKPKTIYLKEINTRLQDRGLEFCTVEILMGILRFWQINGFISRNRVNRNNLVYEIKYKSGPTEITDSITTIEQLADSVLKYLEAKKQQLLENDPEFKEQSLLKFSMLELKESIEAPGKLFDSSYKVSVYEKALLYLNSMGALKLEGGFLIYYRPMNIERLVLDNRKQFSQKEYQKLKTFYEGKIEQIHIMGEYAKKMVNNHYHSLRYVDDYFSLGRPEFITKYFPKRQKEIKRPVTPEKFRQIFGTLSKPQLEIINDDANNKILVAAGPGSGKTKVLVHKIASMLMLEDIKPEQFLMLTFSRAAAMEFRSRLKKLMGDVAYFIDIYTYHSWCFNLLGTVGSLAKSADIISETLQEIENREIPPEKISGKSVLVIDEFQDVNEEEYRLVSKITETAQQIRIIAVGDDDQNIYEFRGSSVKYMVEFLEKQKAKKYELLTNFRSKYNLVEFANLFARTIQNRLKKNDNQSYTIENGEIEINKFGCQHLFFPLVRDIAAKSLKGTTAILTATNEEAALMDSCLKSENIPSKLLLSNDTFKVKDMVEIRKFTELVLMDIDNSLGVITDTRWENSKNDLNSNFRKSHKLELALKIISRYEKEYKQKLRNDWLAFISEMNTDDFIHEEKNHVSVCTMHKAKGREFDNVFLLLKDYYLSGDEKKRAVYVAITRAKSNLYIYTNQSWSDKFDAINLIRKSDNNNYEKPDEITMFFNHKDVDLGFFKLDGIQHAVSNLYAGDELLVSEMYDGLLNQNKKYVLKFSKNARGSFDKWIKSGYTPGLATVNFVIWWYDKEDEREARIVLPMIKFIRSEKRLK